MSVFEDLIEELKEENLLEATVIESKPVDPVVAAAPPVTPSVALPLPEPPPPFVPGPDSVFNASPIAADAVTPSLTQESPEFSQEATAIAANYSDVAEAEYADDHLTDVAVEHNAGHAGTVTPEMFAMVVPEVAPESGFEIPQTTGEAPAKLNLVQPSRGGAGDHEYFKKRAMDEVTGLQLVEHVLSGIEREYLKVTPKPYDDLPVKLALHDFMQVAHQTESTEHAQSEFKLMQETENWCSALSHRDKNVAVSDLRRYCETTRPALSAQALIALTRFYRNAPFSESVRSKFDLVLTRLLTGEIEGQQRELLLEHDEMIQQLKELYADWSSIQLYTADEDDAEIGVMTEKFAEFVREAEKTATFEELIDNEFFNRLRLFKEGCHENFFAPLVAVAAVEANVQIGNRYIELLKQARETASVDSLEEKYGFLYDQTISDATGKTFELIALLNERGQLGKAGPAEIVDISVKNEAQTKFRASRKTKSGKWFGASRWLVISTFLTLLACGGLFAWAEMEAQEVKPNPKIKKVSLENSEFKDFLQTARLDGENFVGITSAGWENLDTDKKKEMLNKIAKVGVEKNFKRVTLINEKGRSVGFAYGDRVEVYNQ